MAVAGGVHWSSRFAFIMASVGFAVGLGNIWRFPYVTGENGGAAFVLVYLACAFGIGAPILIAEMLIGRRGQGSPPSAMVVVAKESGQSRQWRLVGAMGLVAAYTIEIIYAVVVGWVLWYLFKAVTTGFVGFDGTVANAEFAAVLDSNLGMLVWTLVGLSITGLIVYAGVKDGLERAVIVMMPLLFVLLLGLAIYNYFMPIGEFQVHGFSAAVTSWTEERFNLSRHQSTVIVVGSISLFSVYSIVSYNILSRWTVAGRNFNDIMDVFSNQILLPLGGLLIAVFAGWAMQKEATHDELDSLSSGQHSIWHFLIRYVVPPALLIIFVMGIVDWS